ncbi:MAG: DUF115 domain-containing protein [Candidatus Thermoplasmatota archaeon]|jgi:uncharacterized Rossmann fold enzyme|nr:DUF115 domain-containing protein [Candidatus Thermoplasmatota archaeon]
MFYHQWEVIYKKIIDDFNFSIEKDKRAADILEKLLKRRKTIKIKQLKECIYNKEIVVFGAGTSLEESIKVNKKKFVDKIIISCDGSTTALVENSIQPDIIVTDFDGKISDQIKVNSKNGVLVIHAHGDNIDKLTRYVPKLKGNVIGTTQTNPGSYKNVHNFGGFTDGDRAVFLADHFKAKKIFLVGFDFNNEIGKYSFPKKKDKNLKLKKLKWCEYLIEFLMKKRNNIFWFNR